MEEYDSKSPLNLIIIMYLQFIQIASSVWKNGSKDVRDCIKISKLANAEDTEEDINRLISILHQKHQHVIRKERI